MLELFILSLIDRGLSTKYELQRVGGVSLGSSNPALNRLTAAKLVTQRDRSEGMRARQELTLTRLGTQTVRGGWQAYIGDRTDMDVEAILRIVDIAVHYGANDDAVYEFLASMAAHRRAPRKRRGPEVSAEATAPMAAEVQKLWLAARRKAEAKFLRELAEAPLSGRAITTTSGTKTGRRRRP